MDKHKNCVHAGTDIDPVSGSVITPIYQTSTFAQVSPGQNFQMNCMYSRLSNPSRNSLQKQICTLEGGDHCFVTSSGMGAISLCYFSLLKSGDHIISIDDVYGGTRELNDSVLVRMGIEFTYSDLNIKDLDSLFKKNTKMVWMESPTNPTLKCSDIKRMCEVAHKHNVIVIVDNTFMSPYHQNPLELGADFVMHSCTKYINGHSDIVMGAVVAKDKKYYDRFFKVYKSIGDCFLCQRGIKTLVQRMKITSKNALDCAAYLEKHPKVEKALYPGLKSHPNYEIAKKNSKNDGHGGVVTIYLKGEKEQCDKFLKSLKVFTLGVSLGGVESLAECPVLMTHTGVPKEIRLKLGLTDNLIRLAIGIEDIKDLIGDLEQALEKV